MFFVSYSKEITFVGIISRKSIFGAVDYVCHTNFIRSYPVGTLKLPIDAMTSTPYAHAMEG